MTRLHPQKPPNRPPTSPAAAAIVLVTVLITASCGQSASPADEPWDLGERGPDNVSAIYFKAAGGALGNRYTLSVQLLEPSICVRIGLVHRMGESDCSAPHECVQMPDLWRLDDRISVKNRACGYSPDSDGEYAQVTRASGRIDFSAGRRGPTTVDALQLDLEVGDTPPAPIPQTFTVVTSDEAVEEWGTR